MPIKSEYSANLSLIANTAPNLSCPSEQWTVSMTSFPDSKIKLTMTVHFIIIPVA